jgi:hypothetical protein
LTHLNQYGGLGKTPKGKTSMLSNKSIFFYPGIVLSAGWTIMNIVKIIKYID